MGLSAAVSQMQTSQKAKQGQGSLLVGGKEKKTDKVPPLKKNILNSCKTVKKNFHLSRVLEVSDATICPISPHLLHKDLAGLVALLGNNAPIRHALFLFLLQSLP